MTPPSNPSLFTPRELAQEVLRWLSRDIPETVIATLKILLPRYIETGEWKDEIGMMIGDQPVPPLSVQRFALDKESVREEARHSALEEAARVAITMRRREIGELPTNVNAYDFGYAYAKGGNEMSEDIYHAIRALQHAPARVAEGEEQKDAARYRWLRQANDQDWNKLMRDGGEQLDSAIDAAIEDKPPAPESPAKEQPEEQNAAPQETDSEVTSISSDRVRTPAAAAPDVAAMVRYVIGKNHEAVVSEFGEWVSYREAAAMIEKLGQGWIPVSERLPEHSDTVVFCGEGGRMLGHYAANNWWDCREDWPPARKVTHWIPLPPPPERP